MNSRDCEPAGPDPKIVPSPYYICGPTASGKSSLAIETALTVGGGIVNADVFHLYRGITPFSPSTDRPSKVFSALGEKANS